MSTLKVLLRAARCTSCPCLVLSVGRGGGYPLSWSCPMEGGSSPPSPEVTLGPEARSLPPRKRSWVQRLDKGPGAGDRSTFLPCGQTEIQAPVKTLPSRPTTYSGGNLSSQSTLELGSFFERPASLCWIESWWAMLITWSARPKFCFSSKSTSATWNSQSKKYFTTIVFWSLVLV